MARTIRSQTTRLGLAGSAVLVLLVAGAGSAAQGSPPVGTATTQILNRATTVAEVDIDFNGIELNTEDPIDVAQMHFTATPGWSSGWHQHTGPAIVAVKAGVLTFYQGSCQGITVPAGKAYVERPGVAVVARNEGTVVAEWYTTQLIPVASSTREDMPSQCGLR